ncbi:MAG TPA: SgcJ/EcaC family oxidoreductase [Sphingomonas sp.]|nr:SgcJ/EcaC family oxidoreductase [Sphingomonas sp.]
MRRILMALLLLALATPAMARWSAPTVQRSIEAAMTESAAGWNAGDVERFMAIYSAAPQTSFVVKDGLIRGKPAMIARYRERYDFSDPAKRGTLTFKTLDFRQLDPSHALYIARYLLTYPDGKTASGPTTLIFARERGGWRIIADHSS